MKKLFFIAALFLVFRSYSVQPPRLVVGIMVDGLQPQYIEHLRDYLAQDGFKRFLNDGAVVNSLSYNTLSAGKIADIASAMTGSVPYHHGITGKDYYNRLEDESVSILFDKEQIGIGTHENLSAARLLATTVVDELAMQYPSKSKIYAIAVDADAAIMLGGHKANGVAWLDATFNRWAATAYYNEGLSRWADQMNMDGAVEFAAFRTWRPVFSLDNYSEYRESRANNTFKYSPDKNNSLLKTSPAANALVTELALKTFEGEELGADDYPDMLLLQYTVHSPRKTLFSAETEDIYFRLDKDLQTLMQTVSEKRGAENVAYFLFTAQNSVHSPKNLEQNNIAAGYFSAGRSMALLNVYLMAIYGQERWVTGYSGKNIFLNREKAEEKQLNILEMQQRVANFMLEFEGIQSAFTAEQILRANNGGEGVLSRLQNSVNHKTAGDVIITLQAGWLEVDDSMQPLSDAAGNVATYSKAYFCGWQIKHKEINKTYNITDLAPTLCNILKINLPNASVGKVIDEIIDNPYF